MDFPGHGKSGNPPVPWGVEEYAGLVIALMDSLDIRHVHIIAHSFGARVAIVLANQYPGRVGRIIITGGAGIRKPVTKKQVQAAKRYKRYNRLLERLKQWPPLSKRVTKWQSRLRKRYGSPDYAKLDGVMRETFVRIISQDLALLLGSIQAPTLLVWGRDDTETPLWMGQQMEQCIPDAGLVVFENRGHYAFLEESRRFCLIAKQFLMEETADGA